ncbi:MAG: glycoside hydrolase family 9 protein [Fimbriimonadaceae bacterium]|nr:glycoside hydrolase family 9 protein [Fimbriimonadaceae bacterium]
MPQATSQAWRLGVAGVGLACVLPAHAAQLHEVQMVDESHVMLVFRDGWVHHKEEPSAPGWRKGHESRTNDSIETYGKPLDIDAATRPGAYRIHMPDGTSAAPVRVHRRTKVSGTAWGWPDPELTYEHVLFLELPQPMRQGSSYRLTISPATNTDKTEYRMTFDVFRHRSEAVHTSLIGYRPDDPAKSGDLYLWRGDGGMRDYTLFTGRKVWLVNAENGTRHDVGRVGFWKKSAIDFQRWNLTASDVWTADFDSFKTPGRYRLAVEGVGSSAEFVIGREAYQEAFKTSTLGFYFMRIGEPAEGIIPTPRQPRYIPNVDPPGFRVYMTTMSPWHPDWRSLGGDPWDNKDWSKYKLPGEPTNPKAIGGHSDALDWDRHLGHISIIWDMVLPYIITNGRGGDDDLGIRESGNGIPDVIDEARNEVDFWLNLRDDKGGYATGINNPTEEKAVAYQGAAHPYMAWANAANAAILADALRIAKKPDLAARYVAAALEAWKVGEAAGAAGLDAKFSIGNGATSGRDLKQIAAASLYNVTGERRYADEVFRLSVLQDPEAPVEKVGDWNQTYGIALTLANRRFGWRTVVQPEKVAGMLAAIQKQALADHVVPSEARPSRRATADAFAWFQSIQEVQKAVIAHAFMPASPQRDRFLKALLREADWGLGRNPRNEVQMTGLGSRHVDYIYTSGRNDGFPGVHPGHTPYMNSEPWGTGFMADPKYYASRGYPEWEKWPQGEAIWRAPYCFSNNEFTPQQSMRGKHLLLAYLNTR